MRNIYKSFVAVGLFLAVGIFLQGCSKESPEPTGTATRTVSIAQVSDAAYLTDHRLPGVVQTESRAQLAFGVPGVIHHVLVDIGDKVNTGDVLASLDMKPYELALSRARAEAEKAQANLQETRTNFERMARLRERSAVSEQDLDASRTLFESARSQLLEAQTQIELAERDLSKATLKAPYDGEVAARHIEPFEEVSPDQVAFTFNGMTKLIVESSVPAHLVNEITTTERITAGVNYKGRSFDASVAHVGGRATNGLSFPVKLQLNITGEHTLRPGVVVEVNYRQRHNANATFIPHGALVVQPNGRHASIFTYSNDTGILSEKVVEIVDIQSDGYWIRGELRPGELYVASGAAFVSDGQAVRVAGDAR